MVDNLQGTARVLVCDDNRLVADLLVHHLEALGFEVEAAADGDEALAKIEAARFDAVVLDAMMPVRGGFDVVRVMKADPATADIPIIMLTGLSDDDNIRNAMSLGVADFMAKPFSPEELLLRLERLLGREPA